MFTDLFLLFNALVYFNKCDDKSHSNNSNTNGNVFLRNNLKVRSSHNDMDYHTVILRTVYEDKNCIDFNSSFYHSS